MTNNQPDTGYTTWLLGQDAEHRLTATEVTLAGEPTVILRDELDPTTPGAMIRTAAEASNLIQVLLLTFEPGAGDLAGSPVTPLREIPLLPEIDDDRYGQILRAVFQQFGISTPQHWDEIGERRQRPHIAAARAVIAAWQRDHAPVEDGVPLYPEGGAR